MREWLAVAIGGSIGSLARFALNNSAQHWLSLSPTWKDFPLGTLLVNAIGSLLIGLGWALAEKYQCLNGPWELAFRVGFLGGLTTFSSFSLESIRLAQSQQWLLLFLSLALQLILGFFAVWIGITTIHYAFKT